MRTGDGILAKAAFWGWVPDAVMLTREAAGGLTVDELLLLGLYWSYMFYC